MHGAALPPSEQQRLLQTPLAAKHEEHAHVTVCPPSHRCALYGIIALLPSIDRSRSPQTTQTTASSTDHWREKREVRMHSPTASIWFKIAPERCKQETDFLVHFTLAYQAQTPSPCVTSSSCIMYLTSYVRTKRKNSAENHLPRPARMSSSSRRCFPKKLWIFSADFTLLANRGAFSRTSQPPPCLSTGTPPPHTKPEDFVRVARRSRFPACVPYRQPSIIDHRPTSFLHVPALVNHAWPRRSIELEEINTQNTGRSRGRACSFNIRPWIRHYTLGVQF